MPAGRAVDAPPPPPPPPAADGGPALREALEAAAAAWNSPIETLSFPRTSLASNWLVLSDASGGGGGGGVDLGSVTAGPRLRLAALNLPLKVVLVLGVDADAEAEARILAHWRAQIDNPPYHDRVEVFSSRSVAALEPWYAPVASASLANAALLRAVERGAKVVYDWALLRGGLEIELDTGWPVILPDVLPGEMPTTAGLPSNADGIAHGTAADAKAPQKTGTSGVWPAILHHCVEELREGEDGGGGGASPHACAGLSAVTAAAPGVYFTPARRAASLAHVRVIEYNALLTLWMPRLSLAGGGADDASDGAWLSLTVRDIWAQRLAADFGQASVLLPRVGTVRLRGGGGGGGPAPPPSASAAELADAAAAAAAAWESLPGDDDPVPRSAAAGSATRRAAHLLATMCARMTAAAPLRLAPGACVAALDELALWLRGLASAHYENAERPNCSRAEPLAPPLPAAGRAARAWECQATVAAARSAWWARYPLTSACGGRSAVPYYRRWRWAAGGSGWTLAWAGADTPLPGAESQASLPWPYPPLFPSREEAAALARAAADARKLGEPLPPMVPDDVMIFVFTWQGRAGLAHTARRTWGALARNFVSFSTAESAAIRAVVTRATRPDWEAASSDGHNAAFAILALQHLYDVGRARGIKYFINFDDDSVPLWPSVLAYLRDFQSVNGGRYPYSSSGGDVSLTTVGKLLYQWEASGGELHKARLAFNDGAVAPPGMMYAFNLSALHDFMGAIETCPIVAPGDGEQGAIFACAGRVLGERREVLAIPGEMVDGHEHFWGRLINAAEVPVALHDIYGVNEDGSFRPPMTRTACHHNYKDWRNMVALYDAYYAHHFGLPAAAEIPDDLHDGGAATCQYAPPGEHLFSWEG